MKEISFLVLLATVALNAFCQDDQIYALQNQADIRIAVNKTFSENSQLDLSESKGTISGLAITADISLYSDSSLVRVILLDHNDQEYLIYETYPLLAGSKQVSVNEVAGETCSLNDITPLKVKLELVDASIHLEGIIMSGEYGFSEEIKNERQLQQSINKIRRINEHIQRLGQKWVAGETSLSRLSYQEKKSMFGGIVPNFQGFEYYMGGVFVLPGTIYRDPGLNGTKSVTAAQAESQYAKEYSWRNRHGEDWVTSVKFQVNCNSDWAFGATAAAELMINLYYNRHLDYDLSEQELITCVQDSGCKGGQITSALDYIQNYGILLEDCYPYIGIDKKCMEGSTCNPDERFQIPGWTTIQWKDDFKGEIIKGAASANIIVWDQGIQIVGYKVLEAGDSLFVRNADTQWITIDHGDPLIGKTAWQCKLSFGKNWGDEGYMYLVGEAWDIELYPYYGPVYSWLLKESDVRCTDNDEDGYYSWGVGSKPAHCPECPDQPDGDDSDPCIGPMNEYGIYTSSTPVPEANDTMILYGQAVPDLYAAGSNIRWYGDRELTSPVHDTNWFSTGHSEPGNYTYYATQTFSDCESDANAVTLSIVSEIPPPSGNDTSIYIGEPVILTVSGAQGAIFKWYQDSSLTNVLHTGEFFNTGVTDPGIYLYYVTQTLYTQESTPDTVILKVLGFTSTSLLIALIQEGIDTNGDSQISYREAEAINALDIAGYGITDMTGIEAFVNLDTLYCGDNSFTSLDIRGIPALKYLDCSGYLFMSLTPLQALDVSGCSELTYLDCSSSRLTGLDLSGCRSLTYLDCSYNRLTSLDLSANTALEYLYCANNPLSCLDVSGNTLIGSVNVNNPALNLGYMPSLTEVCVWTTPFPPSGAEINTTGSPNIYFTENCSGCLTGIEEMLQSKVSVYPNPTFDFITIRSAYPGSLSLQISSPNGHLLRLAIMKEPLHQLDLSSFQKGVYFLTISSKDFVTTRKIMKL